MFSIIFFILIISLLFASIVDIKTREVPDWLTYGMIFLAIGYRMIMSVISWNVSPLIDGTLGLLLGGAIAFLLFYTGQWGGGDAKLLMGIGAFVGAGIKIDTFILRFILNLFIMGAFWGLFYSIIIAVKNFRKMRRALSDSMRKRNTWIILASSIVLFIMGLTASGYYFELHNVIIALSTIILLLAPLYIFIKSVEECMYVKLSPSELTEGDWLKHSVRVDGRIVVHKNKIGIEREEIALLKKLDKKKRLYITIKEGIPFVPSFLFAYIITYFWNYNFLAILAGV